MMVGKKALPTQLAIAIQEAHQGDVPEIESLRDVAYNDDMFEINRSDCLIDLYLWQKILSGLA